MNRINTDLVQNNHPTWLPPKTQHSHSAGLASSSRVTIRRGNELPSYRIDTRDLYVRRRQKKLRSRHLSCREGVERPAYYEEHGIPPRPTHSCRQRLIEMSSHNESATSFVIQEIDFATTTIIFMSSRNFIRQSVATEYGIRVDLLPYWLSRLGMVRAPVCARFVVHSTGGWLFTHSWTSLQLAYPVWPVKWALLAERNISIVHPKTQERRRASTTGRRRAWGRFMSDVHLCRRFQLSSCQKIRCYQQLPSLSERVRSSVDAHYHLTTRGIQTNNSSAQRIKWRYYSLLALISQQRRPCLNTMRFAADSATIWSIAEIRLNYTFYPFWG